MFPLYCEDSNSVFLFLPPFLFFLPTPPLIFPCPSSPSSLDPLSSGLLLFLLSFFFFWENRLWIWSMLRECHLIVKNCRIQGLHSWLIDKERLQDLVLMGWLRDDGSVSQVCLIALWDSWISFSLILTSPCHVINSMPATDHKVSSVQWIISRTGTWNLSYPWDLVDMGYIWMSSQEWHLNSIAWCWVMRALTYIPGQLLSTDGWWALKLQADMSMSPEANWSFSP